MTHVGSELTTELFCDLLEQSSEKGMISRSEVMEILFENTLAELVDTSSNTLDGDALQDLLSKAEPFPDVKETDMTSVKERLYSGSILFVSEELSSFRSFRQLVYELGDEITIYGYPGISDDSVILEANNYLSITTSSQHPDAAWEFLATMLEPEFQRKYSHRTFPLVKEVLDELETEAKSSETGFSENAKRLLDEMFSTISLGSVGSENVQKIITEEAQAYDATGIEVTEHYAEAAKDRIRETLEE